MATVSLKQHSVLDVAGAILLSAAIYPLVYAGSTQEETRTNRNIFAKGFLKTSKHKLAPKYDRCQLFICDKSPLPQPLRKLGF